MSAMSVAPVSYRVFMLRLWHETPERPCRASLQLTEREERLVFSNLDVLFDYLRQVGQTRNADMPQSDCRRIYLLGGLCIEDTKGEIVLHGNRIINLFTFLALHPQRLYRREFIANLLWSDISAARAGRNFSDILYRLRRALGPDWLFTAGEQVSLKTSSNLWIDVAAFEQLAQADDPSSLEQAIALYVDDLVPEVYEDWVLEQRVALHEVYLTCLFRLARSAEQRDDLERAEILYRRLIQADSLREEAYQGLMCTLAGMDRLGGALAVYAELQRLLADELEIRPSQTTRTLAERLRHELEPKTAELPVLGAMNGRDAKVRQQLVTLRQSGIPGKR